MTSPTCRKGINAQRITPVLARTWQVIIKENKTKQNKNNSSKRV